MLSLNYSTSTDRRRCILHRAGFYFSAFVWYKYCMDVAAKHSIPWIFWILIASVLIILGQSMYKNYIAKDYLFFLEAPCNSATNECYVRSCDIEGDCPPNNLTVYRVFQIPASQFYNCSDNSCLNICPSEAYFCEEIKCSTQSDISCEGPNMTTATSL